MGFFLVPVATCCATTGTAPKTLQKYQGTVELAKYAQGRSANQELSTIPRAQKFVASFDKYKGQGKLCKDFSLMS